jgi:N-acyl-D-amino-acid deacylase
MKRAKFLSTTAAGTLLGAGSLNAVAAPAVTPALSGQSVPELAPVERFVSEFMSRFKIPGGQCAVAKDGRLVYLRGFGYADEARKTPVATMARFRIASSSKPITAVGVMQLVERGNLRLDDKAFEILSHLTPPRGASVDPRLRRITVRNLLEHSGGFDSSKFDPQFDALRIAAKAFDHAPPATHTDLIRYMMGKPLAFDPGSKFVYSNLGYNILGRIIEQVTHRSYGDYITQHVLQPAGARSMKLAARTTPSARLPGEVQYWDGPDALPCWPIYEDEEEWHTYSYGGFDGTVIDAHGGWIGNASDLTRFLDAVGGSTGTQLLKPQTVKTMLARPSIPAYRGKSSYYALGWTVTEGQGMGHNGALTYGSLSTVTRMNGGITLALLFNHLDPDIASVLREMGSKSVAAIKAIKTWPSHNLYT